MWDFLLFEIIRWGINVKKKIMAMVIIALTAASAAVVFMSSGEEAVNKTEEYKCTIKRESVQESDKDIPVINIECGCEVGRDEYVQAHITTSDQIINEDMKIKVRGHTTAYGKKVPYNIKFDSKKNMFGMGSSKKWCLVANMYDPSQMRNKLALDFAANLGMDYVSKCEYAELYYNGEYRGIYLLCTPVNVGKDKVDINIENGDSLLQLVPYESYTDKNVIKTGAGVFLAIEESEKNPEEIKNFLDEFEKSIALGFENMKKYADIESFVDYYVMNELFKDVDFATSSGFFYIKNGKLYAGPVWDYDYSSGNVDSQVHAGYYSDGDVNGTGGIYCQKFWFSFLIQNEEFRNMVTERYEEIQPLIENLYMDNELGKNRIDDLIDKYEKCYEKNNNLWNPVEKYSPGQCMPSGEFKENVENLRMWFMERNEWLEKYWNIGEVVDE